jgi:hypothetical protein
MEHLATHLLRYLPKLHLRCCFCCCFVLDLNLDFRVSSDLDLEVLALPD